MGLIGIHLSCVMKWSDNGSYGMEILKRIPYSTIHSIVNCELRKTNRVLILKYFKIVFRDQTKKSGMENHRSEAHR